MISIEQDILHKEGSIVKQIATYYSSLTVKWPVEIPLENVRLCPVPSLNCLSKVVISKRLIKVFRTR